LQSHVDDGTTAVTYQNLSRTTYTNLNATRNAQSGALTFANLATDYDAAQRGVDSPTLIVTTPAVWTIIEALVTFTNNVNIGQAYAKLAPTGAEQGVARRLCHERSEPRPPGGSERKDWPMPGFRS